MTIREQEKRWEAMVSEHRRQLFAETKLKADHARGNDARLDKAEEATAAQLRLEGSEAKLARMQAIKSYKQK